MSEVTNNAQSPQDAIRICALRQSLLLMNTAMLLKMQSAFVRCNSN